MNKLALQIPFSIFCILALIGLVSSPYWMYKETQLQAKQQEIKYESNNQQYLKDIFELENKMNALERQLLIQKRIGAIVLNDNLSSMTNFTNMPIMVFTGSKIVFKYKIFEKCDFMGESMLRFVKCNFVDCSISKQLGQFIASSDSQNYDGVITFDNCIFRNCAFWDISIIGNDTEIKEYKQNIVLR